jgi:hypothetical protein
MPGALRRLAKMPSMEGVGAGQTANLKLTNGPTYHVLFLRLREGGGDLEVTEIPNYLEEIRLLVDGNVKIEASADFLIKRAQFYGETLVDGMLPIFLGNPWARTVLGEDLTGYGTDGGLQTLTLEIDQKDGATLDSIKVFAEQSGPMSFGKHISIRRFASSFAVIGEEEISDLPKGAHTLLSLDINKTDIDEIEVLADNNRVLITDQVVRAQRLLNSGRVQQAGYTHIDFVPNNRIAVVSQGPNGAYIDGEAFPMLLNEFRLKLDWTAAPGAYDIYETSIQG